MIKILVCDDEIQWMENLKSIIKDTIGYEFDLKCFSNANDLLMYLNSNNADILFLDIQMPELNGIDAAKKIYELNNNIQIIFTSISKDYIQEVFNVNPVFYLLKPFVKGKVNTALNLALERINKFKQTVNIVSNNQNISLYTKDIEYVESNKRTLTFHHNSEEIKCNMKLDEAVKILPRYFLRTHQSYLVNMNHIKRISNNEIELLSDTIIPISKNRYTKVKKYVINFWEKQI